MLKGINISIIGKLISRNLFIISGAIVVCMFTGMFFSEKITPFIYSSLIAFFTGFVLRGLTRGKSESVSIRQKEAYLTVTLSWLIIGVVITSVLIIGEHKPVEESFREGFFQVISVVTCTGYVTADYLQWPEYAWILIFFAMFLGGSTGSTAGGIKMARHLVVLKNISRMFRQLHCTKAILPVRFNGKAIHENTNHSILSILMLTGRLEIYTILILFTRNFWRA